ncbi:hypothetical protein AJ78_05775 [Emergomyces pasteurianus Ep9510]|uniref:Uncharacterized protein n=1 Tax=Emergomyces pasteurianus Ep9510 TaxID=1447872 RepID=A0A1J9PB62_9EURO|nr:hypothetical protein AJ78_05775 [Emergomyces pasteurianus Ep9510]
MMMDEKLPSYSDLYPQVKKRTKWKEKIKNLPRRLKYFLDSIEEDRRAREWEAAMLHGNLLKFMSHMKCVEPRAIYANLPKRLQATLKIGGWTRASRK